MTRPTSFPLAKLRHAGAKVGTIIGHDPHDVNGTSPRYRANWHYAITPPVGKIGKDIDDLLWKYDHSWSSTVGDAVAYHHRNGSIVVYAAAQVFEDGTDRAIVRAARERTESEVATLLDRIATVLGSA